MIFIRLFDREVFGSGKVDDIGVVLVLGMSMWALTKTFLLFQNRILRFNLISYIFEKTVGLTKNLDRRLTKNLISI